jgi:lysophospholipase L1-like esterase
MAADSHEDKDLRRHPRYRFNFRLLIVSLFVNLLLIGAFIFKKAAGPGFDPTGFKKLSDSLHRDSLKWSVLKSDVWPLSRAEMLNDLPADSNSIIFAGSSLTEDFALAEMFGDLRIKNRGIDGNTSLDILNRISPLCEKRPKKIFLETGINDLNNNDKPDSVAAHVEKIITVIKQKSPGTRIFVQSIFPAGGIFKNKNRSISETNAKLERICPENGARFLNFHPSFLEQGGLNDSLTWDGLHLNKAGYATWKKLLEEYISEK